MKKWRILLTRPAYENLAVARILANAQIYSYSLPMLKIVPIAENPDIIDVVQNLNDYQAAIVVSKPAANLTLKLLAKYWMQPPLQPSWFCVGGGTGKILQNFGLNVQWAKLGIDSEALLHLPALRQFMQLQSKFLIIGGVGGRQLLTQTLTANNCPWRKLELYHRFSESYGTYEIVQIIKEQNLNAAFITSKQALEHFAALTKNKVLNLTLFVPGARLVTAAYQHGFSKIYDCKAANGKSLLKSCLIHT